MGENPSIEQIRELRRSDMERLDPGVKRLMNPHIYHVSLSEKMWQRKQKLIASMRAGLPRRNSGPGLKSDSGFKGSTVQRFTV